jgi:hypothetical protein
MPTADFAVSRWLSTMKMVAPSARVRRAHSSATTSMTACKLPDTVMTFPMLAITSSRRSRLTRTPARTPEMAAGGCISGSNMRRLVHKGAAGPDRRQVRRPYPADPYRGRCLLRQPDQPFAGTRFAIEESLTLIAYEVRQ